MHLVVAEDISPLLLPDSALSQVQETG